MRAFEEYSENSQSPKRASLIQMHRNRVEKKDEGTSEFIRFEVTDLTHILG